MSAYAEAIERFPLTPEAVENAAQVMAVALAGGAWETHFTAQQRQLWRNRVIEMSCFTGLPGQGD